MSGEPVDCDLCRSTGECQTCDGTGERRDTEDACTPCDGEGTCAECDGEGTVEPWTPSAWDLADHAYAKAVDK